MDPVLLLGALAVALIVAGLLLKLRAPKPPANSIYAAHKAAGAKLGAGKGSKGALSVVANAAAEKDTRPSVRLLYGTQTGTAERFAKQLATELRARYGGEQAVRVEVTDAEVYYGGAAGAEGVEERLEKENVLLMLFATYGDGEPTDNAADLYSWITTEVDEVEGGAKNAYLHVSGRVSTSGLRRGPPRCARWRRRHAPPPPPPLPQKPPRSQPPNPTHPPQKQNVHFGVFGLGNKQYEHFNAVGKRLHSALATLGASALLRRGDGDDDDCIDDDFDKWTSELFDALDKKPDLLGGAKAASAALQAPAAYTAEVLAEAPAKLAAPFGFVGGGTSAHDVLVDAQVTEVRELHTPQSDRSCVHVEIDISQARPAPFNVASAAASNAVGNNGNGAGGPLAGVGSGSGPAPRTPRTPLAGGTRYGTGDHLALHALNSDSAVSEAARLLGLPLDTVFKLRRPAAGEQGATAAACELPDPFPTPTTLRSALQHFADLHSSPHRDALLALASVATNSDEASRLRRLASREGHDEYAEYVTKAKRSLLEVLADHPSACGAALPLGLFFGSVAPRLQPRYYSISSSALHSPLTVSVTAAVVREKMPVTGRMHEGVATSWLARCVAGQTKAAVWLRRSSFRLPADPQAPVVMIGPGTGLAPFRGFIQERAEILRTGTANGNGAHNGNGDGAPVPAALGPAVLFFGCRRADHDFIYEQELREAASRGPGGPLSALHVAFSRTPGSKQKQYVQHLMEREAGGLWSQYLSRPDCHVYVCGDAKSMAKDVHRALVAVAAKEGKMGTAQAEAFVKAMADGGRYQKDVW
jgi:NADPH-ferrihemoprotein reductase